MTVEFYYCQPVDDPNERRALVRVARLLWRQYRHSNQHFVLAANVPNFYGSLTQLDGLLFGPNFVAMLEFKNYLDPIKNVSRKGVWRVATDNHPVWGGNRGKNPYQQAVNAQERWSKYLGKQCRRRFASERAAALNWSHLNGWVLFYPFLHPKSERMVFGKNQLQLHFRSVDEITALVLEANSDLCLTPSEMRLLAVDVLGGKVWQALRDLLDDAIGYLYLADPTGNWTPYPIRSFEAFTLGRSRHQHIRVASNLEAVSGSHARLEATKQAVRLFDGPSSNGTFVNGECIDATGGRLLGEGDEILLGGLTGETIARLRFETRAPAQGEVVEAKTLPTGTGS